MASRVKPKEDEGFQPANSPVSERFLLHRASNLAEK